MGQMPAEQVRDPRTYAIIGAAQEVHRVLGRGFLEAVYQDALAVEFAARRIPFAREVEMSVKYKGKPLTGKYRADFICYSEVLLTSAEQMQQRLSPQRTRRTRRKANSTNAFQCRPL